MQTLEAIDQYRNRDIRFDFLKVLGVFCIILAHSKPPDLIFQMRNFDVPLMVLISGGLYCINIRRKDAGYWSYLKRRIPRLVAPVWLFLTFFFVSNYLLGLLINKTNLFSLNDIVESFLLLDGIGYVWIIRVFVLMAMIAPLLLQLCSYPSSRTYYTYFLVLVYVTYELALKLIGNTFISNTLLKLFVYKYIFYAIPYGVLLGFGMLLTQIKRRYLFIFSGSCSIIFITIAAFCFHSTGHFVPTQLYKYPPRTYYLSYALFMSVAAYLVVDEFWQKYSVILVSKFNFLVSLIVFLSSSTLWIYLWHIYWLQCWQLAAGSFLFMKSFALTFTTIICLSSVTTYAQKRIVTMIITKTEFGAKNSNILTTFFLS